MKIDQNMFKELFFHFQRDSLFRNSVYLMLATAVMAGFGFFFWLVSARIFSTEDIGIATTLISVTNMIAVLSLIGFDSAFVRFLPNSDKKNDQLNTGFFLVSLAAFIIGLFFVMFIPLISPQIGFVRESPAIIFAFISFCMISALNMLIESAFLAARRTKFIFIIDTIFSIIKMTLPLAFIGWGALGVLSAAAVAQSVGFLLGLGTMIKKLDYRPRFVVSKNILDLVKKYCFVNYIAAVLNLLPVALLPIIILNHLGAQQAAYYYIIMMIANLLYVIPQATAKSLFAESSHDEDAIFENLGKSIKIIGMLLLPGIVIFMALGGKILQFFGKNYSSDGTDFMYLAAMAGIPIAIYYIFTSLFRIRKDLSALILTDIVYAGATMGLAYALIPMGLTGVGLAWIAGSSISGIVGYLFMIREKRCGSIRIGYDA